MSSNIDDVLIKFNIFGLYYVKYFILLSFANWSNVMNCNNYVFTAMEVKYRCADDRFGNDSCANVSNSTEQCAEWVYDDPTSFVAEFDLACQDWKRTLLGTANSFGYMIGLLITGPLADRIGRKKVLIINGIVGTVIGITKAFITYYWIYVVLEFMETTFGNVGSPAFILTMEMVAREKRTLYIFMADFGLSMSFVTLPLAAWSASYWRHMLLIIYSPGLLYILYIFLMDESPRWLLSKGKRDEGIAIVKKIAKSSKVNIDKKDLDDLWYEEDKSVKFSQLLKDTFASSALLKRLFICVTWWIASTFVNYGLQLNAVSLPGNKYVNFSLLSITEVIGNIIMKYVTTRFKRKKPLICSFLLAAVLCTCQAFTPQGLPWLSILLYMSGKVMSAVFFSITYIYTSELFPTYTRNSMLALCSSVGRIGSIIAPQTPLLMVYWRGLPLLLCGVISLIAGLVTLLAPNTADDSLPDTVLQAEAIGQKLSTPKISSNSRRREKYEPNHYNYKF